MIRAIIFDCFGVLASDGWLPYAEKYFGHDPKLRQRARDLNRSVDAGLSDYDEFVRTVADMAGLSEQAARKQIESNVPNERLFDYIKNSLKPKYKLGILSNAGANWLNEIFTPEQVALFDATALSYETGFTKPRPEAYAAVVEKLDVQTGECVFLDDQPRYCEGAREAGMQAIWYKNFEQAKRELEQLLEKG